MSVPRALFSKKISTNHLIHPSSLLEFIILFIRACYILVCRTFVVSLFRSLTFNNHHQQHGTLHYREVRALSLNIPTFSFMTANPSKWSYVPLCSPKHNAQFPSPRLLVPSWLSYNSVFQTSTLPPDGLSPTNAYNRGSVRVSKKNLTSLAARNIFSAGSSTEHL